MEQNEFLGTPISPEMIEGSTAQVDDPFIPEPQQGPPVPVVDPGSEDVQAQQAPQAPQAPEAAPAAPEAEGAISKPERDGADMLSGASKWVDENIGIPFEHTVRDTVGKLFGGEGISADEVAKQRAEGQERMGQEMQDFRDSDAGKSLKANPLVEVAQTIGGSAVGAAETTLGAAEVLGDTIKAIPSLVGLAEEDGRQNPFSSQYEWAQWNLGKDEVGAQTGVGKIAQGFGEFALLMAATGGFQSVAGVGGAMAKAGTLGGKAKVVLSTAAKEGMYGLAADFIDGLAGNDNISNLIKEHAPDWYPSWMTALAVDDSDGPYINAVKNGIEGFGLGAFVGAIGAPIAGMFEVRKLGKAASRADKLDAFVKGAQASLNDTTHFQIPAGLKPTFNQLKRMGDETHFQRLKPVMEQAEKGIPVTWDDMANVFADWFTPAGRALPNDFNGAIYRAIDGLDATNPGFTRNPFTGAEPAEGFSVAIDGASLNKFDPESVQAFLQKNADVLSREDVYLGAWKAADTGITEIELSRVVPDRGQAELLAKAFDQKAIYDNGLGQEIPTFGADALRHTQNGHLKGPMAAPSPSRVTPDFTKAAVDAHRPDAGLFSGAGTATRSPLTNSAIKRIKKGLPGDPGANSKKWLDSLVRSNRIRLEEVAKQLRISPREVAERALVLFHENLNLPYAEMKIPKMAFGDSEILTDEGIVTVNALMKGLTSELHKSLKSVGELGRNGMDNTPHALEMIDTMSALMRLHHDTASVMGRMLYNEKIDALGNLHRIPGARMPSDKAFETGMAKMDELAQLLADGSPKARLKAQKLASLMQLAEGNPAKMRGIWENFWHAGEDIAFRGYFNSLLSNLETHLINGMSSATNAWLRPLAGALGSGDFRHMRAAHWNFKRNFGEAWAQAGVAWRKGEPVSDTAKKMQHGVGSEETKHTLDILKELAEVQGDKNLAAGVKMMEFMGGMVDSPLLAWPSRLMTTTDEFMKAWTARIEFQNKTFAEALQAGDDGGNKIFDSFDELLNSKRADAIDPATGEILDPDILRVAQEGNFQQSLQGVAADLGMATNNNPFLRVFFPFLKTGHNIMVFGLEHTPFLNRTLTEYKTVMAGTDEWSKAVMKGRERLGFGLVGSAGMLYMTGNITGAPDPSATQRDIQTRPPYSIKVGDKWVDYSRLTPFDFPLRMVATVGDAFAKGQLSEDQASYMMSYLGYGLTANLTNRSVVAGLRPLSALLNPSSTTPENMMAVILGIGNSFVPGSSQRRQINNIFRPFKMEFDNEIDRFLDGFTFGALGNGAVKNDFLDGKPVKNLNAGWNAVLNPINVSDRGTSPGRDWLEDLQYDRNVVFTSDGGIKLSDKHRNAIAKKMGELGLGKALDEFAQNPKWEKDRALYIQSVRDGHIEPDSIKVMPFYEKTHDLIMEYRDMAEKALASDPAFMELADEIRVKKFKRAQLKFHSKGDNYLQELNNND